MFRIIATLTFVLASLVPTWAYEIGDTVVVTRDTHLKVEGRTGDHVWPGLCLEVRAIRGKWLWVSNGHPGWLDREYAVPFDRAITVLTELIRQNPRSAGYYRGRAFIWQEKKEYDNAMQDFNEAVRLSPHASNYNNRANVWSSLGDLDRALEDYDKAIRLEPKATYYSNRGGVWRSMDDYDKSLADINEAIRLDPTNVHFYTNRARTWIAKNEPDKAIADFSEAIRLDPNEPYAYLGRGDSWRSKREFAKAIADYEVVIQISPKDYHTFNTLGWLYATCPVDDLRDGKKAVKYATRACELSNWNIPIPVATLAEAYAEMTDWENAIKRQEQFIEITSDDHKPYDKQWGQERLELYKQHKPFREE